MSPGTLFHPIVGEQAGVFRALRWVCGLGLFVTSMLGANPEIRFLAPDNRFPNGAVAVEPTDHLSDSIRADLAVAADDRWNDYLVVGVKFSGRTSPVDLPALAGEYRLQGRTIWFEPRFPFEPGMTYRARFFPNGRNENRAGEIVADFALPAVEAAPTTEVGFVYPSARVLPENLLKFYIHFTAPMSQGQGFAHLELVDAATGEVVPFPFLDLDEELWNRDGTRLTVFFDPGRVKRGLVPRETEGTALRSGGRYTLRVDSRWRDARGVRLRMGFEKAFKVAPPDFIPPDPAKWTVRPPRANSRDPLVIEFVESLDRALLDRMIRIVRLDGSWVEGSIEVGDDERRWALTPDQPWSAGAFELEIDTTLEDTAGNGIGRPFEVDAFDPVKRAISARTVRVPVRISAGE